MENASKALIIAGSILVSIVIITLGVMIVGNVQETIKNSANMSEQEVQAFNSKFTSYEGKLTGQQARALYNVIRSHNNQYFDDTTMQVALTVATNNAAARAPANSAASDSAITLIDISNIKTGKTYYMSYSTDPSSGRITAITLAQQ